MEVKIARGVHSYTSTSMDWVFTRSICIYKGRGALYSVQRHAIHMQRHCVSMQRKHGERSNATEFAVLVGAAGFSSPPPPRKNASQSQTGGLRVTIFEFHMQGFKLSPPPGAQEFPTPEAIITLRPPPELKLQIKPLR